MLRILRQGQKWIVGLVVIGVGFVFAFVFGSGGGTFSPPPGGPGVVLQVEDRVYFTRDVQLLADQITQSQREQLGDAFDADAARDRIVDQAANSLLRTTLLAREAERQGIAASQHEVRTIIRSIPGVVDASGAFDPGFRANVESRYGNAARFESIIRDDLLAMKALRLIQGTAHVSDAEARSALLYRTETAQVAIVRLDGGSVPEEAEIPDEAVAALLGSDPDRIQQAYDDRQDEFDKPERVRARHILLRVPSAADDATKAEIRARLEVARKRIVAGEAFADVAGEVSEDGSASEGGDLGEFPRGRMVAAFEEAAFSLEPGVVSEPVETPFGLHLILVEEKLAPETISFQDARQQIAREEVARERATEAARTIGEEISEGIRAGGSLVELARERELSILRPSAITRRPDGYVPEVGFAPAVMDAAFGRERGSDPTLHELDDGNAFALIEVLSRTEPSEEEIAVQLEVERERMLATRRFELEATWLEERRQELDDAGLLTFDLSSLR